MFFPESLFLLSDRDQQVTWLDPVIRQIAVTGTAQATAATYTVPNDRAFMLQSALVSATPSGGEDVDELRLYVRSVDAIEEVRINGAIYATAANTTQWLAWQGSILLPPSYVVGAGAIFNAGVQSKTVRLELVGMLIPKANIQRV